MTFLQTYSTPAITFLVLLSNIAFLVFCVSLLIPQYRAKVLLWVRQCALSIIAVLSTVAVVGSLIYSEVMGFPPCDLCWVIRIFLYPTMPIALLAMWKKDQQALLYIGALSACALVISFYFSLIHWGFNSSVLACTDAGGSCAKVYVNAFGYITIPFMAFASSLYITVVAFLGLKK